MAAGQHDFVIEQGATLVLPIAWKNSEGVPIDLTGYSARMQVRETRLDANTLLDATTENGMLVIDGPAGTVTLSLSATTTAALDFTRGAYDLEVVSPDGSVVTRLLKGKVTLSPEVTR